MNLTKYRDMPLAYTFESNHMRQTDRPTRIQADLSGGESGIRTHGDIAATAVFKTTTFNHSVISPTGVIIPAASGKRQCLGLREDERRNALGPGSSQRMSGGIECGTSGDDIINQNNVLADNMVSINRYKRLVQLR